MSENYSNAADGSLNIYSAG